MAPAADFDPSQTQLALCVRGGSLSNLAATITSNAFGGSTNVTLHTLNGGPAHTFCPTGHAAVAARTFCHQRISTAA